MIDPPRIEMLPRNQLPILSAENNLAVLTICHAKPYIEVDTTNDEMEKLNRKPFLRDDSANRTDGLGYVLILENYPYNHRQIYFQQEICE